MNVVTDLSPRLVVVDRWGKTTQGTRNNAKTIHSPLDSLHLWYEYLNYTHTTSNVDVHECMSVWVKVAQWSLLNVIWEVFLSSYILV